MNKREDFRIPMFEAVCEIKDLNTAATGAIENLSGTGMALVLPSDFFQYDLTMEFEVGEKRFERQGKIVTRESQENGSVKYRIRFVSFTERARQELHSALVTLEATRASGKE